MRPLMPVALVLLLVLAGGNARAEPDPVRSEYDLVVAAWKAQDWDLTRARAEAFLAAHPGFVHAHTALYLHADASFSLRRYEDVIADAQRYAATFSAGKYGDAITLRRAKAHFKLRQAAPARTAFETLLAKGPKVSREARAWLARIDPKDAVVRGNVVVDYDGKYADDPRFPAAVAVVEKAVPAALARVRARLGLEGKPPPFRVRLRDTGERRDTLVMETSEELHGDAVVQAVVVRTEQLLGRTLDVETSLTHELVHVHHRHALGEAYYGVPKWVREGFAIWVAEQGSWHLGTAYVQSAPSLADADAGARLVNGLGGAHGLDDYPEDYLAFAWVESEKGPVAMKAFAKRLLAAPDAEGAFAAAVGLPFAEALARARGFAEARVRRDLEGSRPYAEARKHFEAGRNVEAAEAYAAFLKAAPPHPMAPRARSDRALALFRAGQLDAAAAAFDALESSPFVECFRDEIAEHRARLAAARGDEAATAAAVATFVRDYSWVDPKRLASARALLGKVAAEPAPAPASPAPDAEGPDED
jgi:tetratricopeptide (TPR) repeat protein